MLDNAKKLFKYKWGGDFFNKLKPSGSEIEVSEPIKKDIKKGALLIYVYIIVNAINSIVMAFNISNNPWVKAANDLAASFGVQTTNVINIQAITSAIMSAIISAVIIFVIVKYLTGDGKRKSVWYFVIIILTVIGFILLIPTIIGLFALLAAFGSFYGVASFALTILAVCISFIGYTNIAVGCIEFCLEANKTVSSKDQEKKQGE